MWQEIIVAICVLAASYFVLRQWLPLGGKKSSGCGGCGTGGNSCSTSGASHNSCATAKSAPPSKQSQ